jgi:formate hydrogenlyase subunit 6/NADH:ubiquinone oxidoreductase subunit I
MMVSRHEAARSRATENLRSTLAFAGPCIGCTDCRGVCAALIEAFALPDAVLAKSRS